MRTRVMVFRTNPADKDATPRFVAVSFNPHDTKRQIRARLPAGWSGGRTIPLDVLRTKHPEIPLIKDKTP